MNSLPYFDLRAEFDQRYQSDPEPINQAPDVAEVLARDGEVDEALERRVLD